MRAERVDPCLTRGLRNAVLRPGSDLDAVHWPDVEAADAVTYAVIEDGAPIATVTVFPEPCPWRPDEPAPWRLRGMATLADRRGRGVGRLVLDAAVAHVRGEGGSLI